MQSTWAKLKNTGYADAAGIYTVQSVKKNAVAILSAEANGIPPRHVQLTVANSRNIRVRPGQRVRVGIATRRESIKGTAALLVPVLCAYTGYFTAVPVASLLKREASENMRAICILALFLLACVAVCMATHRNTHSEKLDIVAVC